MVVKEKPDGDEAELEAHLEAELTRYLEWAQAETTPPRLLELARELQRRLRERDA
jgi:hypothetical protein